MVLYFIMTLVVLHDFVTIVVYNLRKKIINFAQEYVPKHFRQ